VEEGRRGQRWIQQPVNIIVIVVGQVIPVFMYIKLIITDKELSGTVEHHNNSKLTPESVAVNNRLLDSNVVAAVSGDDPRFRTLRISSRGHLKSLNTVAAVPQLGPDKPDTATSVK
jgi:hypothetical protein